MFLTRMRQGLLSACDEKMQETAQMTAPSRARASATRQTPCARLPLSSFSLPSKTPRHSSRGAAVPPHLFLPLTVLPPLSQASSHSFPLSPSSDLPRLPSQGQDGEEVMYIQTCIQSDTQNKTLHKGANTIPWYRVTITTRSGGYQFRGEDKSRQRRRKNRKNSSLPSLRFIIH